MVHGWTIPAKQGSEAWWWSPAWLLEVDGGPMPQSHWCKAARSFCVNHYSGFCKVGMSREEPWHLGMREETLETAFTPDD